MPTPTLDIVFRLGVTGSTDVAGQAGGPLWQQLRCIARDLRAVVVGAAQDSALEGVRSDAPALLRVLSPLADGADRLLAAVALDLEDREPDPRCILRLEAPLPFARDDYETTFARGTPEAHAASVATFRTLLARAEERVLELDGALAPDAVRHASYAALGRTVVRNCDLLIAIWNPEQPSKGPGGTRDTVAYALRAGVPVLHLHPAGERPPRWSPPSDDAPAHVSDPIANLRGYVRKLLLPPEPKRDERRGLKMLHRVLAAKAHPLHAYLAETGRHNHNIWRARDAILGPLHRRGARALGIAAAPDRGNHWLFNGYRRYRPARPSSSFAAQLSTKYQQRYRTSYLTILIAAALTLVIAASSMAGHAPVGLIVAELLLLLGIAAVWIANGVLGWHERYISYRILAELLRSAPFLAATARTAPGSRLGQASTGPQSWVAWVYSATVRATPLATGAITAERKLAIKAALHDALIRSQLRYHARRRAECRGASSFLATAAVILFAATLLVVVTKLVLHMAALAFVEHALPHLATVLAFLAVVLPVFAAALYSLRGYEEFEMLVDQSELLIEELEDIGERLRRIATDQPLALQTLGAETLTIAQLLLQDVREWAQVFKLKAVEG